MKLCYGKIINLIIIIHHHIIVCVCVLIWMMDLFPENLLTMSRTYLNIKEEHHEYLITCFHDYKCNTITHAVTARSQSLSSGNTQGSGVSVPI